MSHNQRTFTVFWVAVFFIIVTLGGVIGHVALNFIGVPAYVQHAEHMVIKHEEHTDDRLDKIEKEIHQLREDLQSRGILQ